MASVRRREFLSMLAAPVGALPGAAEGNASKAPKTFRLKTSGKFPNSGLPVLVYSDVFAEGEGLAAAFETLFEKHGWTSSWRNGLYKVHHYHSTAHEVLGVYRGEVRVCLGGEDGERPRADKNIAALKLPTADPVQGRGGALTRLWRG